MVEYGSTALGQGLCPTTCVLSSDDGERIVRLVAHHAGTDVHCEAPRVSAELPGGGERFEGLLPPIVASPSFAIRKPAIAVYSLDDYAASGIRETNQASALASAVTDRKNILVAGGTSSGETTLTNALLSEVAKLPDRVALIEDTRELQCTAPNLISLRTKDGVASLSDLVRSALRLRPDRIPIGEVRGAEALDLLKAWGTGHPEGIVTIHAGSAQGSRPTYAIGASSNRSPLETRIQAHAVSPRIAKRPMGLVWFGWLGSAALIGVAIAMNVAAGSGTSWLVNAIFAASAVGLIVAALRIALETKKRLDPIGVAPQPAE